MRKLAAVAVVTSFLAAHTFAQEPPLIKVTRTSNQQPSAAPAEHFTGAVQIDSPFKADTPARAGGAIVTFAPGARTAWHTHPLGQTLIVTAGVGWVQQWGKPRQEIRAGDTVWIPPGVKHWHGATSTSSMTHVAIAESQNGASVQWFEKVSDEQYSAQEK
jgi:quercetin dioxygenase-like cupin family protein